MFHPDFSRLIASSKSHLFLLSVSGEVLVKLAFTDIQGLGWTDDANGSCYFWNKSLLYTYSLWFEKPLSIYAWEGQPPRSIKNSYVMLNFGTSETKIFLLSRSSEAPSTHSVAGLVKACGRESKSIIMKENALFRAMLAQDGVGTQQEKLCDLASQGNVFDYYVMKRWCF
eukprot:g36970.t1